MNKRVGEALALVVFTVAAVAGAAVESTPVMLRSIEQQRLWQTDFSPDQPLRWCWGWADSAEVTVVNHGKSRATAQVHTVERTGNELFGSFALPLPRNFAAGGEGLYDVTLVLRKGVAVLSTETARIARVHAATGGSIDVIPSTDGKWGELVGDGVLAYDTEWQADRSAAVSFVVEKGETSRTVPLEGANGYAPLDLSVEQSADVSLVFGETRYATSLLWRTVNGLMLLFR